MSTYIPPQAQAPFVLTTNFALPNTLVQYTANDVMTTVAAPSSAFEITNVGLYAGQTLIINGAEVSSDNTTRSTGFLQAELWLLNATVTMPADNTAWDITYSSLRDYAVAIINLNESHYSSGGYKLVNYNLEKIINLDPAYTSLYAVLVTTNAYTPVNNENLNITIKGKR